MVQKPFWFVNVPASLESCEGKLRRANEHLDAFKAQVALATSMAGHRIGVQDDPQLGAYVFKVFDLTAADAHWSYTAGDCIQNLRAALDHLAYQLAVVGQGRALTVKEEGTTGFLVETDPTKFPQPGKGRLELLRSGEQTRLRELQPFNALDPSIWGSHVSHIGVLGDTNLPGSAPSYLEQLNRLSNIDKHRLVHPVHRSADWLATPDPPIPVVSRVVAGGALVDGAEVGRWYYGNPRPDLPPDMDMNSYFPVGIALSDLLPMDFDAEGLLTGMALTVELVIEVFRPCVEQGAAPIPLSGL
jgi:hypothetical protein